MKRYGHLFEQIVSLDNLRLADEKARKGKLQSYGVRQHDRNREANIIALHDALLSGTYHTSQYTTFTIYEPKEREISRLPYYPDRIVHHAIMNILEPIWTKTFTHNTFACIKKRGIHKCVDYVKKTIRSFRGRNLYCLKIDIRKFYPSIRNDVLMRLIRRKIKDERLLKLLDEIICSSEGLPIGNYLSQYFANLTLCYLMHYVNEELKVKASEYADDIVFFADNKGFLHYILAKVGVQLHSLGLRLKKDYQIFPMALSFYHRIGRGLDYVGYCFFRLHTRIRKSIKHHFLRKVAFIKRKSLSLIEYKQVLCSWLGWCLFGDCRNLIKTIYYD